MDHKTKGRAAAGQRIKREPAANQADEVSPGSLALDETSLDTLVYQRTGYLISRLHQMAVSVFHEEMAAFDIAPRQYSTLVAIGACPGIDQVGVATRMGTDRSTIGGVVDRLVARELIVRKEDPGDRRVKKLFLTDKGKALLHQCRPTMGRVQQRMLEPLAPEEQELFVKMMSQLIWYHNESSRVPVTRSAYKVGKSGNKSNEGKGND